MSECFLLNNQVTKMCSLHLHSHLPDLSWAEGSSLVLVLLFQCTVELFWSLFLSTLNLFPHHKAYQSMSPFTGQYFPGDRKVFHLTYSILYQVQPVVRSRTQESSCVNSVLALLTSSHFSGPFADLRTSFPCTPCCSFTLLWVQLQGQGFGNRELALFYSASSV